MKSIYDWLEVFNNLNKKYGLPYMQSYVSVYGSFYYDMPIKKSVSLLRRVRKLERLRLLGKKENMQKHGKF